MVSGGCWGAGCCGSTGATGAEGSGCTCGVAVWPPPELLPEDSQVEAPAWPPIMPGVGNCYQSLPARAPSMTDFQMSAGSPAPYMVPP